MIFGRLRQKITSEVARSRRHLDSVESQVVRAVSPPGCAAGATTAMPTINPNPVATVTAILRGDSTPQARCARYSGHGV